MITCHFTKSKHELNTTLYLVDTITRNLEKKAYRSNKIKHHFTEQTVHVAWEYVVTRKQYILCEHKTAAALQTRVAIVMWLSSGLIWGMHSKLKSMYGISHWTFQIYHEYIMNLFNQVTNIGLINPSKPYYNLELYYRPWQMFANSADIEFFKKKLLSRQHDKLKNKFPLSIGRTGVLGSLASSLHMRHPQCQSIRTHRTLQVQNTVACGNYERTYLGNFNMKGGYNVRKIGWNQLYNEEYAHNNPNITFPYNVGIPIRTQKEWLVRILHHRNKRQHECSGKRNVLEPPHRRFVTWQMTVTNVTPNDDAPRR